MNINVTASNARATTHDVLGGVDVDVTVSLPGSGLVSGEVTLVRDHCGDWSAYGNSPDTWVSGALLASLSCMDDDEFADALTEIRCSAARVAEVAQ